MSNEMMFPEPCLVHMSSNDADCEHCSAEIGAINTQQFDTNREIVKIIAQLEAQGFDIDPSVHFSTKLDTLIDSLLKGNEKARAKFDATVAVNVLREVVRLQGEAAREALLS